MGLPDREEQEAFRAELRAWLGDNAPANFPEHGDGRAAAIIEWQRRLFDGGWAGLSLPPAYGGRGRSPLFEGILNEEIAGVGAPPVLDSVYLANIVLEFGDEAQRSCWIPRMLSAEDWWCQGFSEPEAGSDLAALRTRAVAEGREWVISGQKTWTTSAQWATHCLVLARTDPEEPRHRGISAFVVRMDSPGLLVRPIRQPSGASEFGELFMDGVRVDESEMLGRPGDGWKLAMSTVTLERGPSDSGYAAKHLALLTRLEEIVRNDERLRDDASVRRALARSYVDVEVLRLRVQRSLAERSAGNPVGPESSADKLLMIRTEQSLHHLAIELMAGETAVPRDPVWLNGYLHSRAVSVYGGTEQIQKDIVAGRVLGLPRG
jgi:alkylation response protein AidB-like acyl-CoA dehydrogenase